MMVKHDRNMYSCAKNSENVYHLCIWLIFISNYTTMQGVEHIHLDTTSDKSD